MRSTEPKKKGQVQELLRGDFYRVAVDGQDIRCYRAGKMRINKINVGVGDWVEAVVEGGIGRITRRL